MRSGSRFQAQIALVVDDDTMLARILSQVLERRGLRVTTAHSCGEVQKQSDRFKVGVFDIELGDGSGVDLAQQLLAEGRVASCVFFTGGATASELLRAAALGPIFQKGQGPRELVEAVLDLMARDDLEAAAATRH